MVLTSEKPKYFEKGTSWLHFIHHKSHIHYSNHVSAVKISVLAFANERPFERLKSVLTQMSI